MRIPRTTYEVLEAGEYQAVVERIEEQAGQYGQQLCWTFRLEAPGADYDRRNVLAWCSPSFTSKAKLGRWARALLGSQAVDDIDELDTQMLTGLPCRLVLSSGLGTDGTERNKVTEVLAPRRPPASFVPGARPWDAQPAAPTSPPGTVAAAPGMGAVSFSGPPEAIVWGYERGVFVNPSAATAEYNRVKVTARPATAAAMWAAWAARVEELAREREQPGDDEIPF
ncbi:MAG: hypothetical protein WAV79_07060 [Anaerolineae bacterium]